MKLVNFASLDPAHQRRNIAGLKNASQGDREIFAEFSSDWERLAFESEQAAERLLGPFFVLPVILRGHDGHQDRVGTGGEDLGEDVQQVGLANIGGGILLWQLQWLPTDRPDAQWQGSGRGRLRLHALEADRFPLRALCR